MLKALSTLPLLMAIHVVAIACTAQEVSQFLGEPATATGTGFQPQHQAPGPETFVMVGSTTLTAQQLNSLFHLSWPQSPQAMTDLLGHPTHQEAVADYYTMPNGHTLTVYYSGGMATGYSLGDSAE